MIIVVIGIAVIAAVDHVHYASGCLHIGDVHLVHLVAFRIVHAHGGAYGSAHFPVSATLEMYGHFFGPALHEVGILVALARLSTAIPGSARFSSSFHKA